MSNIEQTEEEIKENLEPLFECQNCGHPKSLHRKLTKEEIEEADEGEIVDECRGDEGMCECFEFEELPTNNLARP